MNFAQHLAALAALGVILPGASMMLPDGAARDYGVACDAQPALVTSQNAGIPAFLTTFVDPKLIEILFAANKAAIILGEEKKGDWTTMTAAFPVVENTGQVASYGDYSTNGSSGANVDWPQRQSYHYQTITEWGERQAEMAGVAKINWANQLNISSALILNKFQNRTYFFGVAGLQNYGLLNDPNLVAPIAPTAPWITATPDVIYATLRACSVSFNRRRWV